MALTDVGAGQAYFCKSTTGELPVNAKVLTGVKVTLFLETVVTAPL